MNYQKVRRSATDITTMFNGGEAGVTLSSWVVTSHLVLTYRNNSQWYGRVLERSRAVVVQKRKFSQRRKSPHI